MRLKNSISDVGMQRIARAITAQDAEDEILEEARQVAEKVVRAEGVYKAFDAAEAYINENSQYSTFGVESLGGEYEHGPLEDVEMMYLNAGDTYNSTLCYTRDEGFFVTSWGDWLEMREREYEVETGERSCEYCGAWSEEVAQGAECPSCGQGPVR